MISQTAEHALRALLYLARRDDRSVSAAHIARAIGAPANYLSKTLHLLAREGLVTGTRGPTGGFRLARSAADITIADITDVFEDAPSSRMCLLGGVPCSHDNSCVAHKQWLALRAQTKDALKHTTLTALLQAN